MNKVYWGDCRDSMRQMKQEGIKVQTCITSPPYYGLRDYGNDGQIGLEETPQQFIDNLVEVFSCVWDILADDGTLWVNLGDSYARTGGDNSKKGRHWDGRENNPITGHNRLAKDIGLKQKDLMGMPWRLAFALQDFGWYLRQDIIWHKPNPMPESVQDRCTKSHEYIFLLSKAQKYYYDIDSIKEPITDSSKLRLDQDTENQTGSDRVPGKTNGNMKAVGSENRNKRSVWTITTKPYAGAHFAVFPSDLIEPCILAGAPVGGIVLDPFMGSGTTAQVAQNLGRKYLGCELNIDYKDLHDKRLSQTSLELI
jgi:DNA modification methylase